MMDENPLPSRVYLELLHSENENFVRINIRLFDYAHDYPLDCNILIIPKEKMLTPRARVNVCKSEIDIFKQSLEAHGVL